MKAKVTCESNSMVELAREIVNDTRIVHDCLVYDKAHIIDEAKLDWDRIMSMYGDRTGYEAACNEIRIEKLSNRQIDSLLIAIDKEMTSKFSRKVVIYIQVFEDSLELRFHSFRVDEKRWLSDNLDKYDIPILCYIS